ncbi:tRNA isopentenyltransferase [Rozella allomycis CSF55]|uniref:tRNA dimethylallyltransferase n=1 Tax=Rozella allomycis (strain CSF55) TaxID=988480 RepID=A0A075ASP8_ROZAC|nr:tRNA delta(2)-isopentenylpyrophosphate transferase domain-containing protein [Rozella allomycis CSF55]RKP22159.1 tRNA isopentenyltransferase [Rozella allomycis CSF55]|eukprot:EPZ31736.1 tRNA delta(2)-isopentenylpyrophosphate transferase domain-containing protein [Rozella allomycis CSF55]
MSCLNPLAIIGATAVGKSSMAINVAKIIGAEIISCDSVQMVYRDLTIGSNRVVNYENVPHHLVGFLDLDQQFSAGDFYRSCTHLIKEIQSRNKVPLIVGGAMFYLKWLFEGPPPTPLPTPIKIRKETEKLIEEEDNWDSTFARVAMIDPIYAHTIGFNNTKRLYRPLEIFKMTGKAISDYSLPATNSIRELKVHCVQLQLSGNTLVDIINRRCQKMIELGLLSEVERLISKGYNPSNAEWFNSIGYKQCYNYFILEESKRNFDKLLVEFQNATKKYAKQQERYFKKKIDAWLIKQVKYDPENKNENISQEIVNIFQSNQMRKI